MYIIAYIPLAHDLSVEMISSLQLPFSTSRFAHGYHLLSAVHIT